MDAEQAEFLQTSPLIQRLDRRRTQPGTINLSRYSTESTRLPDWIVQRSTLLSRLQTRYSSRDSDSAGGTELALVTASPAPTVVSRAPEVAPVGAITPSTPLATAAPVPSEPLPLTTAAVIATSPVAEPDSATFVTAPETIESVSESAIAPTQPAEQYRIRRRSANPVQSAAIQRKAASDEVSAATVPTSVTPSVQPFHDAVLIAPESPTRARVDDRPSIAAPPMPALEFVTPTTLIAPISTLQSGEPTTEATLVLRHALLNTPPAEAIVSEAIPQDSIVPAPLARVAVPSPLVQPTSLPPIVQRSAAPATLQATATEFSIQKPAAIAPALSISELPLQPSFIWRHGSDAVTNGVLQQRIQPELPLAMSAVQVVQPTIARQPEPTGTSAIAAASSSSEVPPPAPTPTPTNDISVGQIAEQVSRILFRQLTVERERRGMGKWS